MELRDVVSTLNGTVGDLKVAVGELKVTVGVLIQRDGEDRQTAKDVARDVNSLKEWRSRIKGQLALIYTLIGAVGATLIGRILKII